MPFKSEAQRKFLFAKHPTIAKRWAKHTPKGADLPEHVAKSEHEKTSSLISECFSKISKTLVKAH